MERARHPAEHPLIRRDADGNEQTALNWESLTERLIREAQEQGHFDDLPGHGRPLELEDDSFAGEMAVAHHILRNAGVAPPWIEVDKEIRSLLGRIEASLLRAERSSGTAALRLGDELEALAEAHDEAVRRLEGLAPTVRQQRPRLDREHLRERFRAAVDRAPKRR